MNGNSLDDLLNRVPDEFFAWVQKTRASIVDAYERIEARARETIAGGKQDWTQKEWAFYILKDDTKDIAGVLFPMLKGQDYSQQIWKMIKPTSTTPFKDDPDA